MFLCSTAMNWIYVVNAKTDISGSRTSNKLVYFRENSDDWKYLLYYILAITYYMPGLNYGAAIDSVFDICTDI